MLLTDTLYRTLDCSKQAVTLSLRSSSYPQWFRGESFDLSMFEGLVW